MKPPSRRDAELRYHRIRQAALRKAEELARAALAPMQLSLTLIGPNALQAFTHWEGHHARRYKWPWPKMVADAHQNAPSRFEAAVWSGQTLCGLALGRVRDQFCGVDYLEGSPDPNHPLKGRVTVIVSGAAVAYATALDKPEIRLLNPVPDMVPRYQALGFALAAPKGESPYCWWSIS